MDERSKHELAMLVDGRWDPRRGIQPWLGALTKWLTTAFLLLIVFGRYLPSVLAIHPAWGGAFLIPALGLILCWLIPIGIRRRTKRRAQEHNQFLCPWCRYALSGLAEKGICPECGAAYEREICQSLYKYVYASFKPDPVTIKRHDRDGWARAIRLRDEPTNPASADDSHPSPAN